MSGTPGTTAGDRFGLQQRGPRPKACILRAVGLVVLLAGIGTAAFAGGQMASASTPNKATKLKSIGTTRAKAEAVLAIDEPRIKWKASPLANKVPRVMGKSPNGLDLFALDGPPAALTDEAVGLALVNGKSALAAKNLSTLVAVEYGHEAAGLWIQDEFSAMSAGGKFHPINATRVFHSIRLNFKASHLSAGAIVVDINVAHS